MTEELYGALRLVRNWVCNVQCMTTQKDCTHKMAAAGKRLMASVGRFANSLFVNPKYIFLPEWSSWNFSTYRHTSFHAFPWFQGFFFFFVCVGNIFFFKGIFRVSAAKDSLHHCVYRNRIICLCLTDTESWWVCCKHVMPKMTEVMKIVTIFAHIKLYILFDIDDRSGFLYYSFCTQANCSLYKMIFRNI